VCTTNGHWYCGAAPSNAQRIPNDCCLPREGTDAEVWDVPRDRAGVAYLEDLEGEDVCHPPAKVDPNPVDPEDDLGLDDCAPFCPCDPEDPTCG